MIPPPICRGKQTGNMKKFFSKRFYLGTMQCLAMNMVPLSHFHETRFDPKDEVPLFQTHTWQYLGQLMMNWHFFNVVTNQCGPPPIKEDNVIVLSQCVLSPQVDRQYPGLIKISIEKVSFYIGYSHLNQVTW